MTITWGSVFKVLIFFIFGLQIQDAGNHLLEARSILDQRDQEQPFDSGHQVLDVSDKGTGPSATINQISVSVGWDKRDLTFMLAVEWQKAVDHRLGSTLA